MATRQVNGAAIKAIREAMGISQRSLAARACISASQLSNVETGANGMSPQAIGNIAGILGVSLDAITYPVPDSVPA